MEGILLKILFNTHFLNSPNLDLGDYGLTSRWEGDLVVYDSFFFFCSQAL